MGRYVDLHVPDDTIGIQSLRRVAAQGPRRHSLGIVLDAGDPVKPGFLWNPIFKDGKKVGDLTNCIFSYRLKKNIGFALIDAACAIGDRVEARVGGVMQPGTLTDLPFL
jgi:aminomethyltransferase